MAEVEEKIREIIAKEGLVDPKKLLTEARLDELEIESIDLVNIIYNIEEEYDIYIPQDDEEFKLETFGDVVEGVKKLIAEKDGAPSPAS